MDEILEMIKIGFQFFTDHEMFGIPLLYIFIGLAVFGLVMDFLKGKKSDD